MPLSPAVGSTPLYFVDVNTFWTEPKMRAPRQDRRVAQNPLGLWTVERPAVALVDDAVAIEIDIQVLVVDRAIAVQIRVHGLSILHLVLVHEERVDRVPRLEYLNEAADA